LKFDGTTVFNVYISRSLRRIGFYYEARFECINGKQRKCTLIITRLIVKCWKKFDCKSIGKTVVTRWKNTRLGFFCFHRNSFQLWSEKAFERVRTLLDFANGNANTTHVVYGIVVFSIFHDSRVDRGWKTTGKTFVVYAFRARAIFAELETWYARASTPTDSGVSEPLTSVQHFVFRIQRDAVVVALTDFCFQSIRDVSKRSNVKKKRI